MAGCPENPTSVNCGLEAANFLARNRAIIIDPFDEGGAPIRIAATSRGIEDVLGHGEMVFDARREDVARFTCLRCFAKIEITDNRGVIGVEKIE